MLHLSIRLRAKKNPYLNIINLPSSCFIYLFISQISEEWADLNEGASGRGQSMANSQLLQLAPFQHLQLKRGGSQVATCEAAKGLRVEVSARIKNTKETPTQLLCKPDCPTLAGEAGASNH